MFKLDFKLIFYSCKVESPSPWRVPLLIVLVLFFLMLGTGFTIGLVLMIKGDHRTLENIITALGAMGSMGGAFVLAIATIRKLGLYGERYKVCFHRDEATITFKGNTIKFLNKNLRLNSKRTGMISFTTPSDKEVICPEEVEIGNWYAAIFGVFMPRNSYIKLDIEHGKLEMRVDR